MLDLLTDPSSWASLVSLAVLEIVLGIDNIVVLSIMTDRLDPLRAKRARSAGLLMALGLRIILLSLITWITRLTQPVFSVFGQDFSWRDLILIGGGLFLIVKATQEIHGDIEGEHEGGKTGAPARNSFPAVIAQIALIDLVFSLDSIITAVGMASRIEIMIAAVVIAIGVMYAAAEAVSIFLKRHPTTKMLALSFLLMIGAALIADGMGYHFPREYIYFAMLFSALVETFNILAKRGQRRASQSMTRAVESGSGKYLASKPLPVLSASSNPRKASNAGQLEKGKHRQKSRKKGR